MTDLDAIRARHTGKHRCLGAWRAVSGFRMFGLDDGERCDASRLADEVERLRETLDAQEWTLYGRESERARIRAAVEGLGAGDTWASVNRAAVLAAIDGGDDDPA